MKEHRTKRAVGVKIFNPAGYRPVDKHRIRTLIRHILLAEKKILKDIHVIVVDDAYITRLNSEYFARSHPTNVIAFDLEEVSEIYISSDQVRDAEDLYYYIAHGLMHLIGYVHDDPRQTKTMNAACEAYVREVCAQGSNHNPEHGKQ